TSVPQTASLGSDFPDEFLALSQGYRLRIGADDVYLRLTDGLTILYGAGLRLLECLQLRIKNVNFGSNQIVVRAAKRNKDRITLLPAVFCPALTDHLKRVRAQHERNLRIGAGYVELPEALALKYPKCVTRVGSAMDLSHDPHVSGPYDQRTPPAPASMSLYSNEPFKKRSAGPA